MPAPGGGVASLETSNLLLGSYKGLIGSQDRLDERGRLLLVSAARRGGVELYRRHAWAPERGIERSGRAAALLDWGFEHYRSCQVITEGAVVGTVAASSRLARPGI